MCFDHWAMEKFWIFSRPLTLKERRDFVLVNQLKTPNFPNLLLQKCQLAIFLADLPIRAHVATAADFVYSGFLQDRTFFMFWKTKFDGYGKVLEILSLESDEPWLQKMV